MSSVSTSMVKQSSAKAGITAHTSSTHNAIQSHLRFFMDGISFDDGHCRHPSTDPNDLVYHFHASNLLRIFEKAIQKYDFFVTKP